MKRAETCSCSLCNILYISIPPYSCVRPVYKLQSSFCVLVFLTTVVCNIYILRRIQSDMIKNCFWSSCKYPLFLLDFNETQIFSTDFRNRILKYRILWKSLQGERSCCTWTDRCVEVNSCFSQFFERA